MDTESEDNHDRLSKIVSDALRCQGFFMERVNIYRSKCLLCEKIGQYIGGKSVISCGSNLAEGSEIVGSDMDVMKILPGTICINENSDFSDGGINIFTLSLDNCKQGYTRLRAHSILENSFLPQMLKKFGNSSFLSSEECRILEQNIKIDVVPDRHIKRIYYNGGPGSTSEFLNVVCDSTIAIKCHSWPVAATEWIDRQRPKSWPSQYIVDKIASFPVHVVPVGDITSVLSSTQWRFSFTYGERELFWNFTDKQFQCYILLKIIYKANLKQFDELSGYQMKNLIFWISEEYGMILFTNTHLLDCLKICLRRFKDNISRKSFPHYFYRDRNLISSKLDNKKRNQILKEINKVLDNTFQAIVDCHDFIPEAGKYLRLYNGSEKQFILDVKTPLDCGLSGCCKLLKFEMFSQMRQVYITIAHYPFRISLLQMYDLIHDLETGNNFSDNISPHMIKQAYLFCFIQFGMLSIKDMKNDANKDKIYDFFFLAYCAFEKGKHFDELSGKLYSVTFALSNNNIEEARSILFPVTHHTKPFVYLGRSPKLTHVYVFQFVKDKIKIHEYKSLKVGDFSNCNEMVFPKYAVHFVPDPIKYELFLQIGRPKDLFCCVYHPVVYAYYLMFEITRKKNGIKQEKNEILDTLYEFIETYHGPLDLHRAYNLLGYCYYKYGQKNKAVAAYCKSIQNKPDNTNVGVYFLCIIVLENIS